MSTSPKPDEKKAQIGFNSRRKIRGSYKFRFNSSALDALWKDEVFDGLALLRNCIVHRAAIADQSFIDGRADGGGWLTAYSVLNKGDTIKLDGNLVSSLVSSAFIKAAEIVRQVDSEII